MTFSGLPEGSMERERMHAAWVAELVLQLVGKREKKEKIEILDIGCGNGLVTVALIEASPHVFVISVMPEEAVPLVYELLNPYAQSDRCCPAPLDIMEYLPETERDVIDAAIAIFSLNHLKAEDRAFVLDEMVGIMKPGACIVVDGGAEVAEELTKAGFVDVVQQTRGDLAPVVSARRPM